MIYLGNFYHIKKGETITFQLITEASSVEDAKELFKERLLNPPKGKESDFVQEVLEEATMTHEEFIFKTCFKRRDDILDELNKIYLDNIVEITLEKLTKPILINHSTLVSAKRIEGREVCDLNCNVLTGSLPIGEDTDAVNAYKFHKDIKIDTTLMSQSDDEEDNFMDKIVIDKCENGDYPFVILKSSIDEEDPYI